MNRYKFIFITISFIFSTLSRADTFTDTFLSREDIQFLNQDIAQLFPKTATGEVKTCEIAKYQHFHEATSTWFLHGQDRDPSAKGWLDCNYYDGDGFAGVGDYRRPVVKSITDGKPVFAICVCLKWKTEYFIKKKEILEYFARQHSSLNGFRKALNELESTLNKDKK